MIYRILPSLLPLINNSPLRVFLKLWKTFEVNAILSPSKMLRWDKYYFSFSSQPCSLSFLPSLLPPFHLFSVSSLSVLFWKKLFVFFLYEIVLSLSWHFSIFHDGISLTEKIWGKASKYLEFLAHHEAYFPIRYLVGKYIFCLFERFFICSYF